MRWWEEALVLVFLCAGVAVCAAVVCYVVLYVLSGGL